MKKIFLLITLNILCYFSYAQFDSKFYHREVYQNNYDSLLRIQLHNNLTESYYVITYPILGATTSWIPQFIKIFNKIKKTKYDIVLLCYTNGGLRKKDFPFFMKNMLKLSDENIKKVKCIFNDSLYSVVSEKKILVRLQYYFRRHLYYNEGEKWHNINQIAIPHERISIKQTEKIKITGIDSIMLFERDPIYQYKENHLIMLGDAKNEVYDLNTQTGEVTTLLSLKKHFNASDLYCKNFALNDTTKCYFALKNEQNALKYGRKTLMIDDVKYYKNKLVLSISIEAFESNQNNYIFKNDENQIDTIKKGESSLNLFSFIMIFDVETKKFVIYKSNELTETKKCDPYVMTGSGFIMKGDTIVTNSNKYFSNGYTSYGIVSLVKRNNEYFPIEDRLPKDKFSELVSDYYFKNFFFDFNSQIYYSTNITDEIFLLGRNQVQSKFYGNGLKPYKNQKILKFIEDTIEPEINFLIHEIKPILDDKFVLAFINYKNNYIFELKNRMLKTVDIIEASSIQGLERYLSCKYRTDLYIEKNKIFYKSIENDEMYLNIFTIENCEFE